MTIFKMGFVTHLKCVESRPRRRRTSSRRGASCASRPPTTARPRPPRAACRDSSLSHRSRAPRPFPRRIHPLYPRPPALRCRRLLRQRYWRRRKTRRAMKTSPRKRLRRLQSRYTEFSSQGRALLCVFSTCNSTEKQVNWPYLDSKTR